jgi:hypothetical protein
MDQLQISPETQQGLQNLSAKDKQELNQFIVGETQKAQVQSSMSRPSSLYSCAMSFGNIKVYFYFETFTC